MGDERLRHGVFHIGNGLVFVRNGIVRWYGEFTFEQVSFVGTLVAFRKLIDSPDNRTKRLFVFGHADGSGHEWSERIRARSHEPVQTLDQVYVLQTSIISWRARMIIHPRDCQLCRLLMNRQ